MGLERYNNRDSILSVNIPQYAQLFSERDLSLYPKQNLIPNDPNLLRNNNAEVHIYSFSGNYLGFDPDSKYLIRDTNTNSLLVDLKRVFLDSGINIGNFRVVINFIIPEFGDYNNHSLVLSEISPDRTELKFRVSDSSVAFLSSFLKTLSNYKNSGDLNNLIVNFGNNRICKIINFRYFDNSIIFKVFNPLSDEVSVKDTCYIGFESIDPYVDLVSLSPIIAEKEVNRISGPNFFVESEYDGSNATIYKDWDDLLATDTPTSQKIIDLSISSSGQARLNIDYSDFNNFIFYSSAEERIDNFYYKLQRIESYEQDNSILLNSTASSTVAVANSINTNQRRIDNIVSGFDSFERWLYYSPTSSIFTHDISGSITPWPKYLSSSMWFNHHTTSSLGSSWYNEISVSASNYDQDNHNRLWWSIPEHVLMDNNNSNYILFVEMVAQHFDNLYGYINALTKIHERDEHPERGPSNDLLYYIAKSFGWKLQNSRQLSDLWLYQLGTGVSGSYESTGSLFSTSHRDQTETVWRRIVNNLPYLLKSKGTSRGVKALMSMYGIPQTIISIKEYGGPANSDNKPNLIEDRFQYLLVLSGSQYVEIPRQPIPVESGSWTGITRVADTLEFRFRTNYSSSVSQSLWAIEDGTDRTNIKSELQLVHCSDTTGTSSYSGSYSYGRLKFYVSESGYTPVYSDFLPLYDNDIWTVRIWTDNPITGSQPVKVQVARASNNLYGKIPFSSSITYTPSSDISSSWSSEISNPDYIVLGGTTGSGIDRLHGEIQSYKEYFNTFSEDVFLGHVRNPSSYNLDNFSASFYDLYRYFPLGVDVQRWDHSLYTQVSSSHPNRNIHFQTTASFYNFPSGQTNNYDQDVETYYITLPSVGGNVLRSDKIRIEDSYLTHYLSPDSYSEKALYDHDPLDRKRLAIVFSPSDHVNLDIFNQFGYEDLNQYISDPDLEYEREYSELNRISSEYWKKYSRINNVNNLVRILSLYDYTFFDQVKQLAPGRSDLITGVLIESNVLHRPKVQLARKPQITNPQWEKVISYPLSQSGEYLVHETSFSSSFDTNIRYDYLKTTVSASFDISSSYFYKIGYLSRSYNPEGQVCTYEGYTSWPVQLYGETRHHFNRDQITTGLCDNIEMIYIKFSGSNGETGSFIDRITIAAPNSPYLIPEYFYDPTGSFNTRYEREFARFVSRSYGYYSSRSYTRTSYSIPEDSSRNNSRFIGSKLSGAGINIDSPNTSDGGPVIIIKEVNPNNLIISDDPDKGNLTVE